MAHIAAHRLFIKAVPEFKSEIHQNPSSTKSTYIPFIGLVNVTVHSVNPDPKLVNLVATIPAGAAAQATELFARH